MKRTIAILTAAFIVCLNSHALVVTNGVAANTVPPGNLTGWDNICDKGVAIGAFVIATSKMITAKSIIYFGVTNKVVKIVDAPTGMVRFLITENELPSWSSVATNVPSGDFPIYVVASGVGCNADKNGNCITDGNSWSWGDLATKEKRWGVGIAKQYGDNLFWKLGSAHASYGDRDSGNGMFTMSDEYLGPIFAGPNPATRDKASAGALVFPWLKLVDQYMRPAASPK